MTAVAGRKRERWPAKWERLAEAIGGTWRLANALSTTPRVVRRWVRKERTPSGPTRVAIRQLAAMYGVASPV